MAANALRALLLFVGLLLALSAAGIDLTRAARAGRRARRGHRLGPAEAGGQLRQRLRHPGRAQRCASATWCKVDNFEGRITDINTRYTVIRALNGRESIVPNEMLITQRVENPSLADPQGAASAPWCRWPTAPTSTALMPQLAGGRGRACRACWPTRRRRVQLSQLRRRRAGADGRRSGSPTRRTARATCARDVNLALLRTLDELGVRDPVPAARAARPAGGSAGLAHGIGLITSCTQAAGIRKARCGSWRTFWQGVSGLDGGEASAGRPDKLALSRPPPGSCRSSPATPSARCRARWCRPTIDGHRHRHVLDVELVDRFHAQVGKAHHLGLLDGLGHQVGGAAHGHQVGALVLLDGLDAGRARARPCRSCRSGRSAPASSR